ncbi:hypothetical protein VTP01DRAFT_7261 [Rhizomucor pusillus]|uniref:uncharacterized protein n=1 Tax=Rhizomucor pusillus TaxID=4840 RepID=UPI0037420B1B
MTCWIRIADSTSLVTSTATRKRPSRSTACCMRTSGHYWLSSRRAQPAAGCGAPLSPPGISMEPYKVPDPQRARQCGAIHIVWYAPKANRDQLSSCPLLQSTLRKFRWSLSSLHPDPSTGAEAIDTALNLLPSKVPSNLGRWKTLWPALLHLLLLIDQITSPTPFEDEPRPGTLLLEASQNLASL